LVLNKADESPYLGLVGVVGGLNWNLGRIFKQPEVKPLHIGSFWNTPCNKKNAGEYCRLFAKDQKKLSKDMNMLFSQVPENRIEFFKSRCKDIKLHLLLMKEIKEMEPWMRKESTYDEITQNIQSHMNRVAIKSNIHHNDLGDFTTLRKFYTLLGGFESIPSVSTLQGYLYSIDTIVEKDLNNLIELLNGRYDPGVWAKISGQKVFKLKDNQVETQFKQNKIEL